MCLELIRQYPIRKANSHERRRPFANGQFMLFRRDAYERIGGHACVREQIFEDVHIARVADKRGLRIGVVLADGLLHCEYCRATYRRTGDDAAPPPTPPKVSIGSGGKVVIGKTARVRIAGSVAIEKGALVEIHGDVELVDPGNGKA